MSMVMFLLLVTGIGIGIALVLHNRDKKRGNEDSILQSRSFPQIRIVGIIHIFLGISILLVLIFEPGFRMILPLLLPLMFIYFIVGYRFVALRQKSRTLPLIPAVLILLFVMGQIPHSIRLILQGYTTGFKILLSIAINGGLIVSNGYTIYVLCFSKEKEYFLKAKDQFKPGGPNA